MSDALSVILADLTAGRIDAAEAERRIAAVNASATPDPGTAEQPDPDGSSAHGDEPWRAFAREETRPRPEPKPDAAAGTASTTGHGNSDQEPSTGPATRRPQEDAGAGSASAPRATEHERSWQQPTGDAGGQRVSVRSVGRRVKIVADASVNSVAVNGPHVMRRTGNTVEITSEGQARPLEGLNLLNLPRSLEDLKGLGLGTELVVRANPSLVVDAEVTGFGLVVEGMPRVGRVRVTAGGATLTGVRQAEDVLVQAGPATISGPISEGRSRVKCESGALTVTLTAGANATVRGAARLGRVVWPGDGLGAVDEWIVGNGSGRLDLEIVMGVATIKDALAPSASEQESGARQAGESGSSSCPTCGAAAQGKFCSTCGTPLAASCRGCSAPLPPGAKFCPECGTPA